MMTERPTRFWTGFAVATALGFASTAALATAAKKDVRQEVETAADHASYAAESDSLDMVHTHLHHVVNCLVGPHDMAFDTATLNPCADMGNGAIVDAKSMKKEDKALKSALKVAKEGLDSHSLTAAQGDARHVATLLKKAE